MMMNDVGGGQTFWQLRVTDPQKMMALSGSRGRGGLGLPGCKARLLEFVKGKQLHRTVEGAEKRQKRCCHCVDVTI